MCEASAIPAPAERERALALLADFAARVLPTIMRRIGGWKRIPAATLRELRDEVVQELTIDCLEQPAAVVDAPRADRHARWIRIAERWVYRQHVRQRRRDAATDPDSCPAPAAAPPVLAGIAPLPLVQLKNGRCNLRATAARAGRSVRAVRRELERLADRLEDGRDGREFWARRLAEALTDLAVELLHGRDPAARLRRIRRLAARFPLHRTPLSIRRVLSHWTRAPEPGTASARIALAQATRLAPDRLESWLWSFEAALAAGASADAIVALRAARAASPRHRRQTVPARVRLLRARDREAAAAALLARARRRWPHDPPLRRLHEQLRD